jgi:GDPmannose 4,6-dehydratase
MRDLIIREGPIVMMLERSSETHLIFGAIGQDGSYLAEKLSAEGKRVIGIVRDSAVVADANKKNEIKYVKGNILDSEFVQEILLSYRPSHVYNFASLSSVAKSHTYPELSEKINLGFVKDLIDNIESTQKENNQEVYLLQASSSEMFGPNHSQPIAEDATHDPRSPYALHKSLAHKYCLESRKSKNLKIGTAILFNHESPRRPLNFVSRKITYGAYQIARGIEKKLRLGNITISRDWGFAPDYVQAMSQLGELRVDDDFVVSSGELHSLEEMCEIAFTFLGMSDYRNYVESDKMLYRENENSRLVGDSSKIFSRLNWRPTTSFKKMVEIMVNAESNNTNVN